MAFDLYPGEPPLAVAPAATSGPQPFTPRFAADGHMYLSVVRLTRGTQAPPPTIALRVGTGPMTTIDPHSTASLTATSAPGAPFVADVDMTAGADDVFALDFLARDGQQPASFPWALQLANLDTVARTFRWVVADSDADSRQPFISVADADPMTAFGAAPAAGRITVRNHGTGDLVITTAPATDLGSGFILAGVPDPVAPNAEGTITVGYQPPTGLPRGGRALASASYTFATNDPLASLPGHTEARAAMTAVTQAALWNPGDILVTDPGASDGTAKGALIVVDPGTGRQTMACVGPPFLSPAGVAVDAEGNALVADPSAAGGQGALIRVDRFTGQPTVLASQGMFDNPTSVLVTPQGRIVVVDQSAFGGGGLITVDPQSGAQTKLASGGLLAGPVVATLDDPQTGSLVVLNSQMSQGPGGGWLSRVDPLGTVTPYGTTSIQLPALAVGLALDDSGRVLIGQQHSDFNPRLVAVSPGNQQKVLSDGQQLGRPVRLRRDGAGNVLVTDWGVTPPNPAPDDGKLIRIPLAGGIQARVSAGGLLRRPFDLFVVPAAQ